MDADPVTQEAYSHEVISFGFWPGDDTLGDAAYYSYTAPEPDGLRDQPLSAGAWIESGSGSLAILPYETVRATRDPRTTLLAFCQSAYEAGARLAGWDTTSFESAWCPSPAQLRELHATAAADFGRLGGGFPAGGHYLPFGYFWGASGVALIWRAPASESRRRNGLGAPRRR